MRAVAAVALLALLALAPSAAPASVGAQPSHPDCSATTPLGAVAPARPIWCEFPLATGPSTLRQGPNAWADDWQHGLSNADLGGGYAAGVIGGGRAAHWRHQDHWMADLVADTGQYPTLMAAWMRPDRTFRPDDTGRVVVEFEVAVPIAGTRNVGPLSDSWPEVVLSTAAAPTSSNPWGSPFRPNGVYLYEAYPRDWTFGCRLQQSRHPICALYRPDTDGVSNHAGGPDRVWEVNQNGGDVRFEQGGDPSVPGLGDVWAVCSSADDPDAVCRNTFRLELTPTDLWLYVRKPGVPSWTLYYRAGLEDDALGSVLNAPGGFYAYFGDFAYRITDGTVVRFHWDRLAINPDLLGAPPSPSPSPTPSPPPTPTAQASPTPTATPTATPAPALCEYLVWIDGTPTTQNRQVATDSTLRRALGCP
jgi:hypothetical protein